MLKIDNLYQIKANIKWLSDILLLIIPCHILLCLGILRPNVVPVNQSARTGSNVTFICQVSGNPKPTVIWAKGNNSHILQANPRVQTITNINKGKSQLVITGITADDYGNYHCIGKNSVGAKASKTAQLYPETIGEKLRSVRMCVYYPLTPKI